MIELVEELQMGISNCEGVNWVEYVQVSVS
jgi:hypothetical protein